MSASIQHVKSSIGDWTKEQMKNRNTLLFIGACGIAVRAIAPYIADKLTDSPVLVMDEKGTYIIPILSGHMGGANETAKKIAFKTGAIPVITTATDLNHKFAVDLFAKKNGLHIVNKEGIAKVSSKLLKGEKVTMYVEPGHVNSNALIPEEVHLVSELSEAVADIMIGKDQSEQEALLFLKPKEYLIGMGCKRGKEEAKINELIQKILKEAGIMPEQIFALASVDRKKDEAGLISWCQKAGIPFLTYTAEQLQEQKGCFCTSEFVKTQVGVDNVCERAALAACESTGNLVIKKHTEDGMTIAIAKRKWSVSFDET